MALERLQRRSRGRVPEPDSLVPRTGHQLLAVGREGYGANGTPMALERLQRRTPIRSYLRTSSNPLWQLVTELSSN
jgi:hypothetical protein